MLMKVGKINYIYIKKIDERIEKILFRRFVYKSNFNRYRNITCYILLRKLMPK